MSTTTTKRPLAEALKDAEEFRAMFPPDSSERWEIAGSVRRLKPEVSDIEHVILPRVGDIDVPGTMFPERATVNLVFAKLDELYVRGIVQKHIYGDTGNRWGEKYRGVDYKGYLHELFCATHRNWGAILAIRTGPAEYSKGLVTALLPRRLHCEGGFVKYKHDGKIYDVPTEESFFVACGVKWIEPRERR